MPLEPRPVNFASCEYAQHGEQNIIVQHADSLTTIEHADTVVIPGSNNTIFVNQATQVIVGGHHNTVNSNSENVQVLSEEESEVGEVDENAETTVAQSAVVCGQTGVTTEWDVVDRRGVTVKVGDCVRIVPRDVTWLEWLSSMCLGFYVGDGHVVTVLRGEKEVKQLNITGHSKFTILSTLGHRSDSYTRTEICSRCRERLGDRYNGSVQFVKDVRGL